MSKKIVSETKTESKSNKTVDSFVNFASRLGINPARAQNTLTYGHYNFNLITRNRLQLEAAYRGSWVVGKIVDAPAEDMTRAGINITTNEAAENIPQLQVAFSRYKIWKSYQYIAQWARLYGGAIGVFQIQGQQLDTPLDPESITKGQFKGIVVYDRWQLNPDLTDLITEGPDLGLPAYYNIVLGRESNSPAAQPQGQIRVHHSRVIRMVGIELPYYQAITEQMWGESIIERVWDRLVSFDDTTLATANLVDRAQLRTVRVDNLREVIAAGGAAYDGLVAMFETVRMFQTNEGLTLLDKNDEMSAMTYSFAGLSDVLLQFGQQLAGASDIPLVRFFSQSPAGLNATGESDMRMYYDKINALQESEMRNAVELTLNILYRSLFGVAPPKDLQFSFTPLWQMSLLDQATINKMNAETIEGAFDRGLMSRASAMKELRDMSGDGGLFNNITDEEIEEAQEDEPPIPSNLPSEITSVAQPQASSPSSPSTEKKDEGEVPEAAEVNQDEKKISWRDKLSNWIMKP